MPMDTSAIELRRRRTSVSDSGAAADGDDDGDGDTTGDGHTMNKSLEISSIDTDAVGATSSSSPTPASTFQTSEDESSAAIKLIRNVRRKYLSMILVAYVLTLISPGTILWTSKCNLTFSSSMMMDTMMTSTSVNNTTTVSGSSTTSNESNDDDTTNYYYNNTAANNNSTHSYTNVRGNCVDATTTTETKFNILLMKLSAYTVALIGLFLNLQGSNPGRLNKEILSRLEDKEDALVTERNVDERLDSDVERQSFLEPSSSSSTLHRPQQNHQQTRIYCYPHTRRKYCHVCNIHPTLRSHHCHRCKTCVATFDHHCIFLGTCIGERNHFRFWLFVSWNVLCFHLALGIVNSGRAAAPPPLLLELGGAKNGSIINSVRGMLALLGYHHDKGEATIMKWDIISMTRQIRIGQAILVIAKLYMYPLYFIAAVLWIIHTINALKNVTTFELTKGPEHIDYLVNTDILDFPFGNGIFNNMRIFVKRDAVASSCWYWWRRRQLERRVNNIMSSDGNRIERKVETELSVETATTGDDDTDATAWVPTLWKMPTSIDRESEDEDY